MKVALTAIMVSAPALLFAQDIRVSTRSTNHRCANPVSSPSLAIDPVLGAQDGSGQLRVSLAQCGGWIAAL